MTEPKIESDKSLEETKSEPEVKLVEELTLGFPYRIDWYQTEAYVVVTIFRKKENYGDKYDVVFTDTTVRITAITDEDHQYDRTFSLEKQINPEQSFSTVHSSKLEIKMMKAELGPWKHFEKIAEETNTREIKSNKNWDKVAKEIEEDKVEGEALLNKFFGDIYANGSDEVKKAMIKSFTESGGTELSTNWDQVSKDRVTIKPPEGMEWKTWDT